MRGSKFGWHYPPGAANDPNAPYNEPDHSHEHEFFEVDGPILEDGAAMFYAKCEYAEGRYGEGWECEEERWWRCDIERVIKIREDKPNVAYLASEEDHLEKFEHIEVVFEDALISAETSDDVEIIDINPPDNGDGYIRVKVDNYVLEYRQ